MALSVSRARAACDTKMAFQLPPEFWGAGTLAGGRDVARAGRRAILQSWSPRFLELFGSPAYAIPFRRTRNS